MNINECGCRPYGWLGLDGNRCIRVIPRQLPPMKRTPKAPLRRSERNKGKTKEQVSAHIFKIYIQVVGILLHYRK